MSYENILVETRDRVGVIRLNRPQRLNALNGALAKELSAALFAFDADPAIGTMPGFGGTQRLPRAVGKAKAMDWCLTGRMIDAAEAERSGLVARVVPADKLESEALALAAKIASHSLPVVMKVKEAINRA